MGPRPTVATLEAGLTETKGLVAWVAATGTGNVGEGDGSSGLPIQTTDRAAGVSCPAPSPWGWRSLGQSRFMCPVWLHLKHHRSWSNSVGAGWVLLGAAAGRQKLVLVWAASGC
ncbi:hypothetical protein FKM82_026494 [Ascaphus truei]